jgi:hypothetical protein
MSNEHVNQAVRGILDAICPPAAQPVAPLTVEIADDQNTALETRRWEFVEVSYRERIRPCVVCFAGNFPELCDRLPCRGHSRKDGRSGYWRRACG